MSKYLIKRSVKNSWTRYSFWIFTSSVTTRRRYPLSDKKKALVLACPSHFVIRYLRRWNIANPIPATTHVVVSSRSRKYRSFSFGFILLVNYLLYNALKIIVFLSKGDFTQNRMSITILLLTILGSNNNIVLIIGTLKKRYPFKNTLNKRDNNKINTSHLFRSVV